MLLSSLSILRSAFQETNISDLNYKKLYQRRTLWVPIGKL
uniref:Uncharacterized protein n=1 Tax=Rhizophora mucronata TaxID=61149 RepID=A0A2P2NI40_RHIMU